MTSVFHLYMLTCLRTIDLSKHVKTLIDCFVTPIGEKRLMFSALDVTLVADSRNNPSIGEGSVGGMTGSLSASGSHMDHLGSNRDNLSDTASTMALAGASITGSLSGSAMVNYLNR